jgi:hypothetical protein
VGWAKGIELAKLARRDPQDFDCATWLHKARELSKEDFQRAVERELTGKITEPCVATAGDLSAAARCRTWKSITNSFAATPATILKTTRSLSVPRVMDRFTTWDDSSAVTATLNK